METMIKILMYADMLVAAILCLMAPEWLLTYGQLPYALAFSACLGSGFLCNWILENWF